MPSRSRSRPPLAAGERLPRLTLPRAPSGESVSWRAPPRGAPVVVFLHAADCEACRAYLGELAGLGRELDVWDGRPLAVAPGDTAAAAPLAATVPFPVLADADGLARRRCGVPDGSAAVFVADRWGRVYHAVTAASERELPAPRQVAEWLKYLATQCPECGVPDEPGYGAWAP